MGIESPFTSFPFQIVAYFRRFSNVYALKQHMVVHTSEKNFHCEICGFMTHTLYILRSHQRTHDEKRFQCDFCPKKFALKEVLQVRTSRKHFVYLHFMFFCSLLYVCRYIDVPIPVKSHTHALFVIIVRVMEQISTNT